MEREAIEILSDAIKEYYDDYELDELCARFGLNLEYAGNHPNQRKLVTQLINGKDRNKCRRFLETILPKLLKRCEDRINDTAWEVNVFDEHMLPQLERLQNIIDGGDRPDSEERAANSFFTGRGRLADFLCTAKTALSIVDTRISTTTFACIRAVQRPIRLLIGQREQDIIDEIGDGLSAFRTQGHEIEMRRHSKLNDRFLIFNGRCWMASCSLADVDQVTLSLIECIDTKSVVVKEIGRKWREGKVFLR